MWHWQNGLRGLNITLYITLQEYLWQCTPHLVCLRIFGRWLCAMLGISSCHGLWHAPWGIWIFSGWKQTKMYTCQNHIDHQHWRKECHFVECDRGSKQIDSELHVVDVMIFQSWTWQQRAWTPASQFLLPPCQRLHVSRTAILKGVRGAASTDCSARRLCSHPQWSKPFICNCAKLLGSAKPTLSVTCPFAQWDRTPYRTWVGHENTVHSVYIVTRMLSKATGLSMVYKHFYVTATVMRLSGLSNNDTVMLRYTTPALYITVHFTWRCPNSVFCHLTKRSVLSSRLICLWCIHASILCSLTQWNGLFMTRNDSFYIMFQLHGFTDTCGTVPLNSPPPWCCPWPSAVMHIAHPHTIWYF